MSGIYSVEDLLKLRASPLICKPPNLPPIEEWMGTQETNGRRPTTRGKTDDVSLPGEPFQKRPPLLDPQQRRTTADPDRIVLGPPRRSFASSTTRNGGKGPDGPEDTSNYKDRSSFHERYKSADNAESRSHDRKGAGSHTNGRYASRQDPEISQKEKSGRRRDGEDEDAEPRHSERNRTPKWAAGRDGKIDPQAVEDDEEAAPPPPPSYSGFKRDPQARAKLSQPWFRGERGGDVQDENKRETPDWRRDRGRDRDWDRSAKIEADPEWMDSTEQEEPSPAHTQEEFQRWKERMKAGATAAGPDKVDSPLSSSTPTDKGAEKATRTTTKAVSPESDDAMDKFVARFKEAKLGSEQKTTIGKAPTKTRFASLFSPPSEAQQKQGETPTGWAPTDERSASAQISTPSVTDADQAGFARILEMLQTRNQDGSKPKTPLHTRESQQRFEPEARLPNVMALFGQEPQQQQTSGVPNHTSPGIERFPGSRSPTEPSHTRQQPSIHKPEVFLNLLRQASLAPKPQPGPPPQLETRPSAGSFAVPDFGQVARSRSQLVSPSQAYEPTTIQRRETMRSFFDESPISALQYPNEQISREQLSRRPTNGGPPPPFFDDPYLMMSRQNGQQQQQQPQKPLQTGQQPPQGLPPGLQRPPGLEQMPRMPPGWPAPPPQQPPPPARQAGPPAGVSNAPRAMPAPFGVPNVPSQQVPSQNLQRPQQRKYTSDSSSVPNFPPGMGPPPGFMTGGPPPGFPGPGGTGGNYGRFPLGGAEQTQGVSRAFMEMYGDAGRTGLGLRGGAGGGGGGMGGGMPGYR